VARFQAGFMGALILLNHEINLRTTVSATDLRFSEEPIAMTDGSVLFVENRRRPAQSLTERLRS
jgi:hypothetical protein